MPPFVSLQDAGADRPAHEIMQYKINIHDAKGHVKSENNE
jgi:hypothetical protein